MARSFAILRIVPRYQRPADNLTGYLWAGVHEPDGQLVHKRRA
jgi:hypothetical protein